MLLLALETTCDETAAAVIDQDRTVRGAVVASQEALHERFQGVVPEIAARAHLERVLPVVDETLRQAGCTLDEIDVIAVANTPGLAGSLLVGVAAAKTLALVLDKPLIAVNHLHAHIYACRLAAGRSVFPCVGLVVSGGHSHLYDCQGPVSFSCLGGTIDDAAGEAFDKVAAMLGLPFPGGPALSRLAATGRADAYAFPRSFLHDDDRLDFSFSGLKTAVRYAITGPGAHNPREVPLSDEQMADLAASFQEAVVDCLVAKTTLAARRTGHRTVCVGGGVAANGRLRDELSEACRRDGLELHLAPPSLCTDNAVMGALAWERWEAGESDPLSLEVLPGLQR